MEKHSKITIITGVISARRTSHVPEKNLYAMEDLLVVRDAHDLVSIMIYGKREIPSVTREIASGRREIPSGRDLH